MVDVSIVSVCLTAANDRSKFNEHFQLTHIKPSKGANRTVYANSK